MTFLDHYQSCLWEHHIQVQLLRHWLPWVQLELGLCLPFLSVEKSIPPIPKVTSFSEFVLSQAHSKGARLDSENMASQMDAGSQGKDEYLYASPLPYPYFLLCMDVACTSENTGSGEQVSVCHPPGYPQPWSNLPWAHLTGATSSELLVRRLTAQFLSLQASVSFFICKVGIGRCDS